MIKIIIIKKTFKKNKINLKTKIIEEELLSDKFNSNNNNNIKILNFRINNFQEKEEEVILKIVRKKIKQTMRVVIIIIKQELINIYNYKISKDA